MSAQRAATEALRTADANRKHLGKYMACIGYASRIIDVARQSTSTPVERNTDRAWRD
jgi:hypothetical protein